VRHHATSRRRPARTWTAVALAGLALAAGLVLPTPFEEGDPARIERARAELAALSAALLAHRVDTGRWPDLVPRATVLPAQHELLGPGSLAADTRGLAGWRGPYLDPERTPLHGLLLDPWGRVYTVFGLPPGPTGAGSAVWLVSAGPDRVLRTTPEDLARGDARGDDLASLVSRRP
jgi:hypothetical protein